MIERYGRLGLLARVPGATPRERARRSLAVARALAGHGDVVVGAERVAVFGGDATPALLEAALAAPPSEASAAPLHRVPVRYDGPDLAEVAGALGVPVARVVELHAAPTYEVELLGFLPGFAYLGEVDERLRVPRRATPREAVSPGAVALADRWTGVYPCRSPGGWRWIGTSLAPPWLDPSAEPPVRVRAGDRVRFEPAEGSAAAPEPRRAAPPARPALVVTRASGLATVQDLGRPGRVGEGLPPSGAADPRLLVAANRALGGADGAAAIELLAGSLELEARRALAVAIASPAGGSVRQLAAGDRLRARGPALLAVEGGLDVPVVAGARATLLAAGLGGLEGRVLRAGDVLGSGDGAGPPWAGAIEPARAELLFDEGPDAARFPDGALDALERATLTVSPRSDRTGTRLEGLGLRGLDLGRSPPLPLCRGAIELTPDGEPIVLGPDHPTTGGYAVLAVLRTESAWDLARLPPGAPVRLRRG